MDARHDPSLAALFAVLKDRGRLRVLFLLVDGEQSVGELVRRTGQIQQGVSHSLRRLHLHGLVESRRVGPRTFYKLSGGATAADDGGLIFHAAAGARVRVGPRATRSAG